MPLLIPPEICATICSELDPLDLSTLYVLCRTCRVFQDEAQRVLYRSVNLERGTMRSVKSWCLAVTRHSHLAERLYSLSFRLPEAHNLTPTNATILQRALIACVNLKELKIASAGCDTMDDPNGWLMQKDFPFRLTKFTNLFFDFSSLRDFWKVQTKLEVISMSYAHAHHTIVWDELPNQVPKPGNVAAGNTLSYLARHCQSLTTLNLVRGPFIDIWPGRHKFEVGVNETISLVASSLQALSHLSIIELAPRADHNYTRNIDYEMLPLEEFSRLETFALLLRGYAPTLSALNHSASAIVGRCATLHKVVFGAETSERRTCTLSRAVDGSIDSQRGSRFNPVCPEIFDRAGALKDLE
ncbi:hypothetical protein C8R46DRAFT_1353217 [Mycena filopes]|nr:hypothetical protein C8R46DRAFT_1353217 [Mycena filopes]